MRYCLSRKFTYFNLALCYALEHWGTEWYLGEEPLNTDQWSTSKIFRREC